MHDFYFPEYLIHNYLQDANDRQFRNPLASGVTSSGTFLCPPGGVQVLVDFQGTDDKSVQEDSKHYALKVE